MEKIHSKLRRTDYYDFGHGLTLMNVLFKTEDGKLDRIDTYIGVEGNEFVCVGCAKDLSAPGVIFSYGEYVDALELNCVVAAQGFYRDKDNGHLYLEKWKTGDEVVCGLMGKTVVILGRLGGTAWAIPVR